MAFSSFDRWAPLPELRGMYDVTELHWGIGDLYLTLQSEGCGETLRLIWPGHSVQSCRLTPETYREDCWIGDPAAAWTFYVSDRSPALEELRRSSVLFPGESRHFLLVGAHAVADIFATEFPAVTIVP